MDITVNTKGHRQFDFNLISLNYKKIELQSNWGPKLNALYSGENLMDVQLCGKKFNKCYSQTLQHYRVMKDLSPMPVMARMG